MSLFDEPEEFELTPPPRTLFSERLPNELAYALKRVTAAFMRLGSNTEAAAEMVDKLNELANV